MGRGLRTHIRSNAVGYVALLVALCGVPSAFAIGANIIGSRQLKPNAVHHSDLADNSVGSPEVIDDSLNGNDIDESSLSGVQSADQANSAAVAQSADQANTATVAQSLTPAEDWIAVAPGSSATNLCTNPANTGVFCSYQGLALVPWHNVGNPFAAAAFYKDQLGTVHLKGVVAGTAVNGAAGSTRSIFRLPGGYRPADEEAFGAIGQTGGGGGVDVTAARVDVLPDGSVDLVEDCNPGGSFCSADGSWLSLSGITFRAGG